MCSCTLTCEPYGGTLVSHINWSKKNALIIYFRVGGISYREREGVRTCIICNGVEED